MSEEDTDKANQIKGNNNLGSKEGVTKAQEQLGMETNICRDVAVWRSCPAC